MREGFIAIDSWIGDDSDEIIRPDGKNLVIEFDKIFNAPSASVLNSFIIKKDSYVKYLDVMCDYINYFIKFYDTNKELLLMYATIMKVISDSRTQLNQAQFIDLMYKVIFTDSIKAKITELVDDNYCIDVEDHSSGKKYAESLEFRNEHVKLLMKISMGMKLMVPVMFHYINKNNIQKEVGYLYPYYQNLFYIFDDEIDLYQKLWITVTSRVNTSSSQNKKMFYQREIFGVTPLTLTDELLKDNIIGETIWRYTFDKNPINFNSVILNKQLRYFARVRYAKDLIAVDNEVGSDGLTGVDKLEMNQFHADESRIIFSDINIPDTISRLKKKIMIDMPKEEIEYYMEYHTPSDFHVELVNTFYATDFGGYSDLSLPTKREYMTLLVLLKRRLQIEGQKYLPLILSGNIHTKLNVRTIQNTKFLTKIQTSDLYQDLINNKYRYLIEYDPKAILNKISIVINNTFTLVDYDLQEHFGENIEVVNDVVSDEILNFYKEA